MIYDTNNWKLLIGFFDEIEFTKLQNKLLICLSSGNFVTYKEINMYIYGFFDKYTQKQLYLLLYVIRKKTKNKLKIRIVRDRGLVLETQLYFL